MQHLIADLVTIGLIEKLEVVQIDEQNRQTLPGLFCKHMLRTQMVVERSVIQQAGQRVHVCCGESLAQLSLSFDLINLAVGDVGLGRNQRLDFASCRSDLFNVESNPEWFTVFLII